MRWISLSEGVSWLAFGRLLKKNELIAHLAEGNYSAEKLQGLSHSVGIVTQKARNGELKLQGKFVDRADDEGGSTLTESIPSEKLEDYRAFDIHTGGLRYGEGLMWLPDMRDEKCEELWLTHRPALRPEHYVNVMVNYREYSLQCRPRRRPPISDAELAKWWNALSDDEKRLGEAEHDRMLKKAFPNQHVSRERLRETRNPIPRKRGRPKNRTKVNGD